MKFTKLHTIGNDWILFDARDAGERDWSALTERVCDRHTGVGADGTLLLLASEKADARLRMFRSDGSETSSALDGIPAFARYVFSNGIVRGTSFSIETNAGVTNARILLQNGRIDGMRVDMGEPQIAAASVPVAVEGRAIGILLSADGRAYSATALRVGVPYTVVSVDTIDEAAFLHDAPILARDPLFPEGTNVLFCKASDHTHLAVRAWDRQSLLSSCSGACAAAVAGVLTGRCGRSVDVAFPLGSLQVDWQQSDNRVYLTAPAAVAFSGVWND